MIKYDSSIDTLKHIKRVSQLLSEASIELINRASSHDNSKLKTPEKELFDEYTPKLKDCTYGSDEYKSFLIGLKVALDHHYANNSHHPEHYKKGIAGMNLFDIIEMFFDWKAAGERTKEGCIYESIRINKERFEISNQLTKILENTAHKMGYIKKDKKGEIMAINNITFEIDEDLRRVYLEAKKVLFVLLGDGDFCFNYEDTLADLKKAVSKLEPIDKYGLPIIPERRAIKEPTSGC